jgi:hypothetical protein
MAQQQGQAPEDQIESGPEPLEMPFFNGKMALCLPLWKSTRLAAS